MQIGIVGLGRMGANIGRRLMKNGHTVVGYDASPAAVKGLEGATGAASLEDVVAKLAAPRTIWVMLPSGKITEDAIADAAKRVAVNDRANALLAKLDDGVNVRFLNTNAVFLGRDGRIPWAIMPDQLHPTAAGYQLWAQAIDKPLADLMK